MDAERFSKNHYGRNANNKNLTGKMEVIKLRNNRVTLDEQEMKTEVFNHFSKKFCNQKKNDLQGEDFQELLRKSAIQLYESVIYSRFTVLLKSCKVLSMQDFVLTFRHRMCRRSGLCEIFA